MTVTMIGYQPRTQQDVYLTLAQNSRLDFRMTPQAVTLRGVEVTAEQDPVLNAGRTGAATVIDPEKVALLPSVKRSTRDLTRVDPRSDGKGVGGRTALQTYPRWSYFTTLARTAQEFQTNASHASTGRAMRSHSHRSTCSGRIHWRTSHRPKSGTTCSRISVHLRRNDALGQRSEWIEVVRSDLAPAVGRRVSGPSRGTSSFSSPTPSSSGRMTGNDLLARTGPGVRFSRVEARVNGFHSHPHDAAYDYDPGP